MSNKEPEFRALTAGANVREPLGQLPIPSLEERARLFLRAVHGEHDFTSSQYAEAHSTILSAMASDIAAKSKSGIPDEPPVKPTGRIIEPPHDPLPTEVMCAPGLDEDQPMFSPAYEARREHPVQMARLEVTPSPMARRALATTAVGRSAPRPRISLPLFPAPTHKPAKRGVFIWSAALSIFAGLCVLGGLALYQTATRSVSVTAQSTPGGMPVAAFPRSNDGSNAIDFDRPAAPPVSIQSLGINPAAKDIERSRAGLIERVRTVIAAGDIEAVRATLSRLVEGGNASAAVDLGSTYDPNILDALGVRNFSADVAKARLWYQRAQQMGSTEAVGLLESLERSERRSR